jgi:hypothetical protein
LTTVSNRVADAGRPLGVRRLTIARNELFAGLYILGCVNGMLGHILLAMKMEGWNELLSRFDVIVLFACFAGISLVLNGSRDELRSADFAVAVVFLGLVILPIFILSWVAVTGLSLYILLFASDSPTRRRGALIMLALTVPKLWGRLLFQLFERPLLQIDASLTAFILGTDRVGNMVGLVDGSGYLAIVPVCSSYTNLSLAFLCFVSVTQWANHRWSAIDALWLGLTCASVILVNITRIALMGLSRGNYEALHNEWGGMVAGFIILSLTVGFSLLSARRELFSRV